MCPSKIDKSVPMEHDILWERLGLHLLPSGLTADGAPQQCSSGHVQQIAGAATNRCSSKQIPSKARVVRRYCWTGRRGSDVTRCTSTPIYDSFKANSVIFVPIFPAVIGIRLSPDDGRLSPTGRQTADDKGSGVTRRLWRICCDRTPWQGWQGERNNYRIGI